MTTYKTSLNLLLEKYRHGYIMMYMEEYMYTRRKYKCTNSENQIQGKIIHAQQHAEVMSSCFTDPIVPDFESFIIILIHTS